MPAIPRTRPSHGTTPGPRKRRSWTVYKNQVITDPRGDRFARRCDNSVQHDEMSWFYCILWLMRFYSDKLSWFRVERPHSISMIGLS